MKRDDTFEEKLARIYEVTRASGDTALARILEIKPPSVAAARKRKQIPGGWIEKIAQRYQADASWLLFGVRAHSLDGSPMGAASYGFAPNGEDATRIAKGPDMQRRDVMALAAQVAELTCRVTELEAHLGSKDETIQVLTQALKRVL